MNQGAESSIVPIQTGELKLPFFCVHSLSGEILVYAELARNLGPDQSFYGLQAQGLDRKQKPHTKVETMASHYIREIRTVQPEGPYILGGMCFGGLVAFEMAQQLHAQGQEVGLLVFFDTPCPHSIFKHRMKFKFDRYSTHLKKISKSFLQSFYHQSVSSSPSSFLERIGSISKVMQVLKVDRANQRAMWNYHPQHYAGRIVLFLPSQPQFKHSSNLRMKWKEYAADGVEFHTIPGGHHTMLREPHVRTLAEKLNKYLSDVQSGYSNSVTKSHK